MSVDSARAAAQSQRERGSTTPPRGQVYARAQAETMTTEEALAQLPRHEWTVLHDVDWPGRRYTHVDHVVVGPSGVFVIDSETWTGTITVQQGEIRQNGRRRESAAAGAEAAARTAVQLTTGVLDPALVTPMLCFVGTSEIVGRCRNVLASSPYHLTQLLMTRPAVLDADQRAAVVAALHTTHGRVGYVPPVHATARWSAAAQRMSAPIGTPAPAPAPARATASDATGVPTAEAASSSTSEAFALPGRVSPDAATSTPIADAPRTMPRPHPVHIDRSARRRVTWRAPRMFGEGLLATAILVYWTQPEWTVAAGTWLISHFV